MSELAARLLRWHASHGRHALPWQNPRSPYRVWLSEVMLQQTRVSTVLNYFPRFIAALPDLPTLAAAERDTVLALWSGLGYYRRARYLHDAAQLCMQRHAGRLPCSLDELMALPGIGRSTAGAILAQAHDAPYAILDGNAKRVLARHFAVHGWPGKADVNKRLWQLAEDNTPARQVANYTQAIMDLGAMLCTRRAPACLRCPLQGTCQAHAQGVAEDLPTPTRQRKLPEKQICVLILQDQQGRTLLQRRNQLGVWPDLWSLPEAADDKAAHARLAELVRSHGHERSLPLCEHGFTHFKLRMQPLLWTGVVASTRVADAEHERWVAARDLGTMGIPAPIKRLLQSVVELS